MMTTIHSNFCCLFAAIGFISAPVFADANFSGPDSVANTIAENTRQKQTWREQLASQGLTFGVDYFALAVSSPDGSQGNSVDSASGIARFYGSWELTGQTNGHVGSLIWKIEQRHAYSDTAPKNFAFIDDISGGQEGLGYVGMIAPAYNDQGFRVTNLHWKQLFHHGQTSLIIGWQDVTDYVDTYALASPWSGFTNLAFSTGVGAIGLPDDGILALSAGHMITEDFYVIAGIADAKGKSDDIFDGFDTLFNDTRLYTTFELGWTASQEQIFTDNIHVTLWHMDAGSRHSLSANVGDDGSVAGGESGQGVNFSWSQFITPQLMPFIRGGAASGDVALYDSSLSTGVGYFGLGAANNNLGLAINWSETNSDTLQQLLGAGANQFTTELYYHMQLNDYLQITPDIQYIHNPALSTAGSAWVFAIRARVFI